MAQQINSTMSVGYIQNLIQTGTDKVFYFAPGNYNWDQTLKIMRSDVTLMRDPNIVNNPNSTADDVNIKTSVEGNAIQISRGSDFYYDKTTLEKDIYEKDINVLDKSRTQDNVITVGNLKSTSIDGKFVQIVAIIPVEGEVFQRNILFIADGDAVPSGPNQYAVKVRPIDNSVSNDPAASGNVFSTLKDYIPSVVNGKQTQVEIYESIRNVVLDNFNIEFYNSDAKYRKYDYTKDGVVYTNPNEIDEITDPDDLIPDSANMLAPLQTSATIYAEQSYGVKISNINIRNSLSNGIFINSSIGANGYNNIIDGAYFKDGGGGWALIFKGSNASKFTNMDIKNVRQAVIFSQKLNEYNNYVEVGSTTNDINFHGTADLNNVITVRDSKFNPLLPWSPEEWHSLGQAYGTPPSLNRQQKDERNTVTFKNLIGGDSNGNFVKAHIDGGNLKGGSQKR